MSESMWQQTLDELDQAYDLLGELYQILGQFQDEIPEETLDKIVACIEGDYNGRFYDEFPSLLPFYRGCINRNNVV